ncbi:MAG: hypothetical protein AB9844_03715 [Clostridiaceae bacterium]
MKKVLALIMFVAISFSAFGCAGPDVSNSDEENKKAVVSLVEGFGTKLQMVSLLAPSDTVKKSMEDNYSDYVTAQLLEKFKNDPINAPGRLTSSPWPERIEVTSAEKTSEGIYKVEGEIIEITSTEKKGEVAATRPITLEVRKSEEKWLISSTTLGEYVRSDSILYINSQYGFTFILPKSWEGYAIVTEEWEGYNIGGNETPKVTDKGPKLSIRHPKWTKDVPRQDVPIMVFTLDQWNRVQQEKLSVSAAPIPPSELGRNSKYVFALPARYNFAFPEGFEEVEDILDGNPLKGYDLQ